MSAFLRLVWHSSLRWGRERSRKGEERERVGRMKEMYCVFAICMLSMRVLLHAILLILIWSKISNIRSEVRLLLVHDSCSILLLL